MHSGEYNFLMSQAEYQSVSNLSFTDKRMKRLCNWLEGRIYKILFYSLLLSLLGYFFR